MSYYQRLNKIYFKYLISLIITIIFLGTSTYCWFFERGDIVYHEVVKENIKVSKPITFASLPKRSDNNIADLPNYNFTISNTGNLQENIKISIASDILANNISNNYVKYQLNNSKIASLNTDGVIYIDDIKEAEEKEINLKIWISETYQGDLNYRGLVVVS